MTALRRALVALVALALVCGSVGVGTAAAASGSGKVRTVPKAIASDCSVDVTSELNDFVARAKKGSTVQFAADGCYSVDRTLLLRNRKDFTLDGNGATLQAPTSGYRDRRHVLVWGGRNVQIRDLIVRGANRNAGAQRAGYNPDLEFQHGFSLQGVKGARLTRVQVYDVFGDFVYVGSDFETQAWSREVEVTGSTFDGSGRQGISVVAGKGITIARNELGGTPLSLFDLEANTPEGGALDVRILDNVTGPVRHFWLANKGAGVNIGDVVVRGNRTEAATGGLVFVYGPASGYRGPFTFVDNSFTVGGTIQDEGSRGAFFFSRAKDIEIRDNRVTLPAGRGLPAVENRNSLDIVLEGNVFLNAGQEVLVTGSPVVTSP